MTDFLTNVSHFSIKNGKKVRFLFESLNPCKRETTFSAPKNMKEKIFSTKLFSKEKKKQEKRTASNVEGWKSGFLLAVNYYQRWIVSTRIFIWFLSVLMTVKSLRRSNKKGGAEA